jgi:hypothetical protein
MKNYGNIDTIPSFFGALNATNTAAGGSTTLVTTQHTSTPWDKDTIAKAVAAATAADHVIITVTNSYDEGAEGRDRKSIALSSDQQQLCRAVLDSTANANAKTNTNTKVALVLINGASLSIDGMGIATDTPAVLQAGMPGIYGGTAMSETIFGANNPGGKLPVTVYNSNYTDLVSIDDMSMTAGPGRSYKYYSGPVLYPFGYGLSYTTFTLEWNPKPPTPDGSPVVFTTATATVAASTTYNVKVTNTGTVAGDEVVLAYFKPHAQSEGIRRLRASATPVVIKQLFAFERVHLAVGESTSLSFTVNATMLALVDGDGHTSLHPDTSFDIVFSRGHGKDLEAVVDVRVPEPIRTKEFRKWW